MSRLLFLIFFLQLFLPGYATIITVKNIEELNIVCKKAQPGDTIILQNGEWKNVTISLDCKGTKEKPIVFKAQTPGKVLITGNSKLKLGGQYITMDGLYFTNGYAGRDAVISFRIDNKQLANDCRVTNTVINDFNNPKKMDENNWVAFFGKNNRLDHCSFIDKKNMGVLLAVLLDDERSRENLHSIDHNYFGRRLPLASNGGEIIRVGLSQHCQFNSNTRISNNFFEHCDGEAEIISIKSCANEVEENVFKECQGAVVLRHGDNNIVAGNYFLGNDKQGTGGVRVINKGQLIISNIFYKCRGDDFRSPLVIMNGVPNSPPTRYVQVTDAQIVDNSFYECSPLSFCEGSDSERSLPPDKVLFSKNSFYNTRDSVIYKTHDNIKGISFGNNNVSITIHQQLADGFIKTTVPQQKKLSEKQMKAIEFPSVDNIPTTERETLKNSGANWFLNKSSIHKESKLIVNCADAKDIYKQLSRKEPLTIRLTGKKYIFSEPLVINSTIKIEAGHKEKISFASFGNLQTLFIIKAKASLHISNVHLLADSIRSTIFISSDSSGNTEHYSFIFNNSSVSGLKSDHFFYAYKSSLADSIIIRNSSFTDCNTNFFTMVDEKEDKGYYNAEKIFIGHNSFSNLNGNLANIYRGGSDESTLGPHLIFSHNNIHNCKSIGGYSLITLTGVQQTEIFSNRFSHCNEDATLILYKDNVRAKHYFERNSISNSGKQEVNKYVTVKNNTTH